MSVEPSPEVQSALQLLRRGRFIGALALLEHHTKAGSSQRRKDAFAIAIVADLLQRTGRNDEAEHLALSTLRTANTGAHIRVRLYFVLGNVLRERGDIANAIKHLQAAIAQPTADQEFLCWVHLRLLAAVAELNGSHAALARLDEIKRVLTKFGDPRPFSALHLWQVETDTMVGALDSARHHLHIAESLLSKVDDVWLHGYLAINSSVLHYYSANVMAARQAAEAAIAFAKESGHRTTRRAAYANLGYFEFTCGQLAKAEDYFQDALQCCEQGTANEIAILDNIAETKLERGDLNGCRSVLSRLEALAATNNDAKRRQYSAWALQTRIRLCLREGRTTEAKDLSLKVQPVLDELPHARFSAESRLLTAEAFLSTEPSIAANNLAPMFAEGAQLAPDLFAELERVSGKTLKASGFPGLARVHFERAAAVFSALGHSLGRERSLRDISAVLDTEENPSGYHVDKSLDRFRTLLDMRNRAELFGREAAALLQDLNCATSIDLRIGDDSSSQAPPDVSHCNYSSTLSPSTDISIAIGSASRKKVTLSFAPLADPKSTLTALSFKRVIGQILASSSTSNRSSDHDIVWTSDGTTAVAQGAVFASEAMLSVLRTVKQIAPTDMSVLVTGETGTGKEVIAKTIHESSRRSAMPFLAINCAAVPKELLESQLFGHRRGAFSGATEAYPGIVRAANGGTLFLDEIGEIPIEMQTKLLRFLEMNEVHPVGEPHPVKVNVRLIFATNGDLEEAVSRNAFRRDLFYRLNVIPIKLPPLRERREEIPILTNIFAQRFAAELSKEPLRFSTEAMERLIFHSWPGNIRQLANEMRRLAAVLESGACVAGDHLAIQPKEEHFDIQHSLRSTPHVTIAIDQPMNSAMEILESEMIRHALRSSRGRVAQAADTLGISRKGLYLKRVRLGMISRDERN